MESRRLRKVWIEAAGGDGAHHRREPGDPRSFATADLLAFQPLCDRALPGNGDLVEVFAIGVVMLSARSAAGSRSVSRSGRHRLQARNPAWRARPPGPRRRAHSRDVACAPGQDGRQIDAGGANPDDQAAVIGSIAVHAGMPKRVTAVVVVQTCVHGRVRYVRTRVCSIRIVRSISLSGVPRTATVFEVKY